MGRQIKEKIERILDADSDKFPIKQICWLDHTIQKFEKGLKLNEEEEEGIDRAYKQSFSSILVR